MPPKKKSPEVSGAEFEPVESVTPEPAQRAPRLRNEVAPEPKMKFSIWFMVKAQDDQRLKTHHLETLRAYMSSQGLGAEEPVWRFEAAFRSYNGE